MVFLRNVEVGTLRVNSGTGSALNNETDLLREIREALRNGQDEPTVVQAIQIESRRVAQAIENLSRQMAGIPGSGGPPIGGGGGGGGGGGDRHIDAFLETLNQTLSKLELALVTFEGGGGGTGGGRERDGYFQREIITSTYDGVKTLFARLENNSLSFSTAAKTFTDLVQNQLKTSAETFAASLLGAGVNAVNLGSTFRSLHSEIVGMRESGVFGSNILTPMQFFLEGITRVREGILTTSDSFRTVMGLVGESLQQNVMTPLFMTGKSAAELAKDLHEARNDIRDRGQDSRAFLSTREANAALNALVEQQMKFGVQAQFRDVQTELMMMQDQSYLRVIASMTGQTVGKLEDQLRASRAQQDVLVGLGRLNQDELRNFTLAQQTMSALPGGKQMADEMARLLAYGRSPQEVMAQNPEYAGLSRIPGYIDAQWNLIQTMMRRSSPEEILRAVGQFGSQGVGGIFQGMAPVLQGALGQSRDAVASSVVAGNAAIAKPLADAGQRMAAQESPFMAMIQRLTEVYQENIAPFMRLEFLLGAQTAALALNTTALWGLSASLGGRGMLGLLGTAARAVGPIAGGAVGAATAYAAGSSNAGIIGSGTGSLIGGVIGSFIGPWGTMIGTTAGGIIGNYLGEYIGAQSATRVESVRSGTNATPVDGTVIGTAAGGVIGNYLGEYMGAQSAARAQGVGPGADALATYTDTNTNMLSQLITSTTDGNVTLSQIYGELKNQTAYLTAGSGDGGSPASTPATGMGLTSKAVPRAMSRPDASTAAVPL